MSVPSFKLAPPPPGIKGGGQQSLAGEGAGGANSDDWRESLALCLLCGLVIPKKNWLNVFSIERSQIRTELKCNIVKQWSTVQCKNIVLEIV